MLAEKESLLPVSRAVDSHEKVKRLEQNSSHKEIMGSGIDLV